MEALYQYLVHDLFRRLLSGDDSATAKVLQAKGLVSLRDGDFLFTLPNLFKFALENFEQDRPSADTINPDDYIRFRKTLYDHPTNTLLKHYGGSVEIETANENQKFTVYRLRRIE
jgi:hypothetical protein